jgi:ABC-2 type transport system permease protein
MTDAAATHRIFSFSRVAALAQNTLLELVRQKVFYFMVIFAIAGISASFISSDFKFQDQFQVVKDVSLGAMSIFSWLLATLATAMILPKDMEDRTLYTILAKPVSRFEYLLGKLAGVLLLLLLAIALMSVVFLIVLYARQQVALSEAAFQYGGGPHYQAEVALIKAAAFTPTLVAAVALIFTKAAICAAMTLMISTFATSWIFTVMISVVGYVIGHVQPIARDALFHQPDAAPSTFMRLFFGVVAVIFPDFQLFNIVDEIVVGNVVPPDMLSKTFGLGLGYVAVFTIVSYVFFAYREL